MRLYEATGSPCAPTIKSEPAGRRDGSIRFTRPHL